MIKECLLYMIISLIQRNPKFLGSLLDFMKDHVSLLSNKILMESLDEFENPAENAPFQDKIKDIRNALLMEYNKRRGIPPS